MVSEGGDSAGPEEPSDGLKVKIGAAGGRSFLL